MSILPTKLVVTATSLERSKKITSGRSSTARVLPISLKIGPVDVEIIGHAAITKICINNSKTKAVLACVWRRAGERTRGQSSLVLFFTGGRCQVTPKVSRLVVALLSIRALHTFDYSESSLRHSPSVNTRLGLVGYYDGQRWRPRNADRPDRPTLKLVLKQTDNKSPATASCASRQSDRLQWRR